MAPENDSAKAAAIVQFNDGPVPPDLPYGAKSHRNSRGEGLFRSVAWNRLPGVTYNPAQDPPASRSSRTGRSHCVPCSVVVTA